MRYMNGLEPTRFLRQIEAEGVEFCEFTDLEERLLVSANWRSHFIRMIVRGNFWHPKSQASRLNSPAIKTVLFLHGFDQAQTKQALEALGALGALGAVYFEPTQASNHDKMAA